MRASAHRSRLEQGFTLIEMIVVVTVIGILAAIAIPSFTSVQTQVKQASTQGDLRSDRTALVEYTIDNNGVVPSASGFDPRSGSSDLIGYGWSQSTGTTGFHYATNSALTAWCLDMTNETGVTYRITTNTDTVVGTCSALASTSY